MSAPELSEVEHPSYDRLAPWDIRGLHSDFDIPKPPEAVCPHCGGVYKGLGTHWRYNQHHRPRFSADQRDLIVGLLMGDGYIDQGERGENPRLKVNMTTPRYLEWLDREFGCLSLGIHHKATATEAAREKRRSGFRSNAEAEDYSSQWIWKTRAHPDLSKLFSWYSSGEKIWPEDVSLTPTTLRAWFVSDGHYSNSGSHDYIQIAMSNEVENTEKVSRYFESADLPTPNFNTHERWDGGMACTARFSDDAAHELWEYMGSPPPGFRYKWPDEYC